jgi:hypothetical protein
VDLINIELLSSNWSKNNLDDQRWILGAMAFNLDLMEYKGFQKIMRRRKKRKVIQDTTHTLF